MSTASNRYQVSALNEKLRLCSPPVMSNLMSCVESFLANSHLPMAMQTTHKTPDQPRGNYVAEIKITEKCWKQGNSDQNVGGGASYRCFYLDVSTAKRHPCQLTAALVSTRR